MSHQTFPALFSPPPLPANGGVVSFGVGLGFCSPFCHRLVVVNGDGERLVHGSLDHFNKGVVQLLQGDSCRVAIDKFWLVDLRSALIG